MSVAGHIAHIVTILIFVLLIVFAVKYYNTSKRLKAENLALQAEIKKLQAKQNK